MCPEQHYKRLNDPTLQEGKKVLIHTHISSKTTLKARVMAAIIYHTGTVSQNVQREVVSYKTPSVEESPTSPNNFSRVFCIARVTNSLKLLFAIFKAACFVFPSKLEVVTLHDETDDPHQAATSFFFFILCLKPLQQS